MKGKTTIIVGASQAEKSKALERAVRAHVIKSASAIPLPVKTSKNPGAEKPEG